MCMDRLILFCERKRNEIYGVGRKNAYYPKHSLRQHYDNVFGSNSLRKMTDFYLFCKVVILPQLLFCEMVFFYLYLANMPFSSETKCVHQ